jgi:hypothetical protein
MASFAVSCRRAAFHPARRVDSGDQHVVAGMLEKDG